MSLTLKKIAVTCLLAIFLGSISSIVTAAPGIDDEVTKLMKQTSTYLKKGDYENALVSCDHALKLYPDNMKLLAQRASVYWIVGRIKIEQANLDLDRLIQLATTPVEKHAFVAMKHMVCGQYIEAKVEMDKAIELNPPGIIALYMLRSRILVELSQYEVALSDVNKIIQMSPNDFGAYWARAEIYEKLGRDKEAKRDSVTGDKLAGIIR